MARQCVTFNGTESSFSGLTSKQVAQTITAALTANAGEPVTALIDGATIDASIPAVTATVPKTVVAATGDDELATGEDALAVDEDALAIDDDAATNETSPMKEFNFNDLFKMMMAPQQSPTIPEDTVQNVITVMSLEEVVGDVKTRLVNLGVDLEKEKEGSNELTVSLVDTANAVAANLNQIVEEEAGAENAQISEKQANLKLDSVRMLADMSKMMQGWMVNRYIKANELVGKSSEEMAKIVEAWQLRETYDRLLNKVEQVRQVVQKKLEGLTEKAAATLIEVAGVKGYRLPNAEVSEPGIDEFNGSETLDYSDESPIQDESPIPVAA